MTQQPSARSQIGNACHILHLSALIHGFFIFIHTDRENLFHKLFVTINCIVCAGVRVCPVQGTGYRYEKIPYELRAPAGETFPDTFATHFQQFL